MNSSKTVETIIGALVVAVAVAFLYFAYTSTSEGSLTGYTVSATFNRVDGLSVGTDVRMSGIKIGTVSSLNLNPKTYLAVAHLTINNNVKLPDDSSIKITSSGILGNSYLSVTPGGSDKMIAPGGRIVNTQGSVDLMGLIGRMITSGGK
jgi:phospholipid/cholesterol/gamma-HCH transport system substrate-binding protein